MGGCVTLSQQKLQITANPFIIAFKKKKSWKSLFTFEA